MSNRSCTLLGTGRSQQLCHKRQKSISGIEVEELKYIPSKRVPAGGGEMDVEKSEKQPAAEAQNGLSAQGPKKWLKRPGP